jgi:hypothetical protein
MPVIGFDLTTNSHRLLFHADRVCRLSVAQSSWTLKASTGIDQATQLAARCISSTLSEFTDGSRP